MSSKYDLDNYFSDLKDNFDHKIFCEFLFFLMYWRYTFRYIIDKKIPTISKTILSNFRKMGLTVFRTSTIKLRSPPPRPLTPNTISYRSWKYFNENKFDHELDQDLTNGDFYNSENTNSKVTEFFDQTLNKYKEVSYYIRNKSTSRIF